MNKAVFLDRDGTINIDKNYLYKKEDFEFIKGVIEFLKKLQKLSFKLIIITNQSGIARGYYKEDDMHKLHQYMLDELKKENVIIDGIYYCPHYNQDCDCRKPKTKFFHEAAIKFDIDFSKSFALGDKERDLTICKEEPVTGILFNECSQDNDYFCSTDYNEIYEYIRKKC